MTTGTEATNEAPKKRGRKPSPNSAKQYFGDKEERAVEEYLSSTDPSFRNKVFTDTIYPALVKMVESIIRRYNLFTPQEDFNDTFHDVMSFLVLNMDKYDPHCGNKAYSYYGTIVKNRLVYKRTEVYKNQLKFSSYENTYNSGDSDNREEQHENTVEEDEFTKKFMKHIITYIDDFMDVTRNQNLTENDIKVGSALRMLLEGWEDIFRENEQLENEDNNHASRKFNKTYILYFIKENTALEQKDIRESMAKYKMLYDIAKEDFAKTLEN